tara:strand:+ start:14145 stop:15254 length:1110 start_codon:yes stop_codon:yes gene_type:complete
MLKFVRYIGSKEKLIPFLDEVIFSRFHNKKFSILEGFSGTGIVSQYLNENYNTDIYMSDISLYSKIFSSILNINNFNHKLLYHIEKIIEITYYSKVPKTDNNIIFNELSINGKPRSIDKEKFYNQNVQSRMFFTEDVGHKIDYMRHYINKAKNKDKLTDDEVNILLSLTIYFADKNANTTSVYAAYLKKQNFETKPLKKELVEYFQKEIHSPKKGNLITFLKDDILNTLDNIPPVDIIYLDPPYNTRKYESNYHILNYISDLNFKTNYIKENSKTALPVKNNINLFSSKKGTREIFKKLIEKGLNKCNILFISYSSDGEMSIEEIKKICDLNNFNLTIHQREYQRFKSNQKGNNSKLNEIIFEIRKNND